MSALALSWSGGKDSSLALRALRAEGVEPDLLLTTVTADYERVSTHGVRRDLLRAQAEAAGVRLVEVEIPAGASNQVYEAAFERALAAEEVAEVAFADLFLADIRTYREEWFERIGVTTRFPVWGLETDALAREFIASGFEATLCAVDIRQLDASFAGRSFDDALLTDLPPDTDPCGENGEFHTFVHAGPTLARPLEVAVGEVVLRDGFAFCDLALA